MTICIDCRMINASGIGVYLRGILPFLLQSENDFLLLGSKEQLSAFSSNKKTSIFECEAKPFSLRELFFFSKPLLQKINSTDIFYSPFFNIPQKIKIPIFTTVHDIVFPDMPELTSRTGLAARMWFYRRAYKKSKKIFTVSEFSKSRIESHLGKKKQIVVTHSAIGAMFSVYKKKANNSQKKDTIVFIGNIKKHKGLDCLLDAFILARNEGIQHKLIIIGSKNNFRTSDKSILRKVESAGDGISFTGFISDEKLMEYLSTAALLVQPSLYEGFCHPPLEAMVLGTQALISDIPVFREIYAEYPVTFFRAGDSDDLKEKLLILLLKKSVKTISLSQELTEKYTFQKTASIIMKEIE